MDQGPYCLCGMIRQLYAAIALRKAILAARKSMYRVATVEIIDEWHAGVAVVRSIWVGASHRLREQSKVHRISSIRRSRLCDTRVTNRAEHIASGLPDFHLLWCWILRDQNICVRGTTWPRSIRQDGLPNLWTDHPVNRNTVLMFQCNHGPSRHDRKLVG